MSMKQFSWSCIQNASSSSPVRVLTSGCLVGQKVGWNDTDYSSDVVHRVIKNPKVQSFHFCPEHIILGTPRLFTTIYNGNGYDVLDGKAQVLDTDKNDHSEKFRYAAEQMLAFAKSNKIDLAILMEISDSCGSSTIYLGNPEEKVYQKGPGVSAALLIRHGIPVLGSRDYRTLGEILRALENDESILQDGIDFCEDPWYKEYFGQYV